MKKTIKKPLKKAIIKLKIWVRKAQKANYIDRGFSSVEQEDSFIKSVDMVISNCKYVNTELQLNYIKKQFEKKVALKNFKDPRTFIVEQNYRCLKAFEEIEKKLLIKKREKVIGKGITKGVNVK